MLDDVVTLGLNGRESATPSLLNGIEVHGIVTSGAQCRGGGKSSSKVLKMQKFPKVGFSINI